MLEIAHQLPDVRDAVEAALRTRGLNRERVLACAMRLLDLGTFRIGSEQYAEENGTYGLATLRREHVSVRGERTFFPYTAKGGIEREVEITDRPTATVVRQLLERPDDAGEDLLAYQTDDGAGGTSPATRSTPTSRRSAARRSPRRTSAPGTPRC